MNVTVPFVAVRAAEDLRAPISMWDLLVWAYKRQMVHYETDQSTVGYVRSGSSILAALAKRGWFDYSAREDCWSVNAAGTTAHEDAYRIHRRVLLLKSASERDLIMCSAIRGSPPDWDPYIEPPSVEPVRRGPGGRIKLLYDPGGKRPIACEIRCLGVPDSEAAAILQAARESYDHWWRLLRRLRLSLTFSEDPLTRWRVTDIGAPCEPWNAPLDNCGKSLAMMNTVEKSE